MKFVKLDEKSWLERRALYLTPKPNTPNARKLITPTNQVQEQVQNIS